MKTKLSPITTEAKRACRRIQTKAGGVYQLPHGTVLAADLPDMAIEGLSTATGYFKPGVRLWIIAGSERVVFLGAAHTETTLPEFTVLTESGSQALCQYGRDFRFAE